MPFAQTIGQQLLAAGRLRATQRLFSAASRTQRYGRLELKLQQKTMRHQHPVFGVRQLPEAHLQGPRTAVRAFATARRRIAEPPEETELQPMKLATDLGYWVALWELLYEVR